jgi:hypothetical protein
VTLILTCISPLGIVHVSDSNLTYPDNSRAGVGKKLHKAKHLRMGVACAGVWDLNGAGTNMGKWLPDRIGKYEADGGTTVRGLAEYLSRSLESDLTPDEMRRGCWLHVAGYTPDGYDWHPEMYVVSNVKGIHKDGNYQLPGQLYFRPLVEEYRTPRSPTPDGRPPESNDPVGLWFNGFPAGRIAWNGVKQQLEDSLLPAIWNQRGWKFHEPRTLREQAVYLSLHLSVIAHLFQMSSYGGPIIGGRIQRMRIKPPVAPKRAATPPEPRNPIPPFSSILSSGYTGVSSGSSFVITSNKGTLG